MLYPPWFCPGNASPLALKRGGSGSVHRRGEPSTCSKCSRFSNFLQNVHTAWSTHSGSNLIEATPLTLWRLGSWTRFYLYLHTKLHTHKSHVLKFYMPMRYCSLCSDSRSQKLWGFTHRMSTATPYPAIYLAQFNCLRAWSLISFYMFTPETTERHWLKRVHR